MIKFPQLDGVFETPRLMFALARGNPVSEKVLAELEKMEPQGRCKLFASEEEISEFFKTSGIATASAVVIFDQPSLGRKHFHPTCRNRRHETRGVPSWSQGAQWIVAVGPNCDPARCARQMCADFGERFAVRLGTVDPSIGARMFPWGPGKMIDRGARRYEEPPVPVAMPETIHRIVAGLNDGPNLAAAIADKAFAAELPLGSKISWYRVVPEPLQCDGDLLNRILGALRAFEQVSDKLLRRDPDVQELILAGVDLPVQSELSNAYLFPRVANFSVGRPDLHYTGQGLTPFASEIDEMPGGMPELVHIDATYGVNQERWRRAFDWLCNEGPLVFLVSSGWSECYIPETEWLVGHLKRLRYPVDILTTDRVDELEIRADGVFLAGAKVGTIWRQFPIFETRGKVAEVVMAAYDGRVRMVPEFAHFGNKAWFSVFRSHEKFYRDEFSPTDFDLLDTVLPHSYIVGGGRSSFPFRVNGDEISNVSDLANLPESSRDRLVLKICGANTLAARSWGVLMGNGIKSSDWMTWIAERMEKRQPFVVQNRLDAGIAKLPVLNMKSRFPELFSCRIMTRPWSFNGEVVSIHGCAVPSYLYRVHGMVDMAVVPFSL